MKSPAEKSEKFHFFARVDAVASELKRVRDIAQVFKSDIESETTIKKIAGANVHGKPSHGVQACIIDHAAKIGFQSEKRGLFSKYKTSNLRPDYYLKLSDKRGIILEVERGKTLANNMDLLDLWKCHICDEAQYLFLMVPILRPDENGKNTKVFSKVVERLEPFFFERNYVNVFGLFIFGY